MNLWLSFLACSGVIVFCGSRLSRYGDVIAQKSGLGRAWIGLLLLATVTSLPELVTGISAVTYAGVPDIAVGDVFGSCCFNLLILAALDFATKNQPVASRAQQGHLLSAGFGILMLSLASLGLLHGAWLHPFGWISPVSLLLAGIYLIAIRLVYNYEKRQIDRFVVKRVEAESAYHDLSLRRALIFYAVNAAIVLAAAVLLPRLGAEIAEVTGLGQAFTGSIFIAIATSLPELVVSFAALRLGAVDLAIANLFGSNLFNVLILVIDDFFYIPGPLLAHVSASHAISAVTAVAMTSCAIIGLTYRSEKKHLPLSWDAAAMVFLYLGNLMLLYAQRPH